MSTPSNSRAQTETRKPISIRRLPSPVKTPPHHTSKQKKKLNIHPRFRSAVNGTENYGFSNRSAARDKVPRIQISGKSTLAATASLIPGQVNKVDNKPNFVDSSEALRASGNHTEYIREKLSPRTWQTKAELIYFETIKIAAGVVGARS